MSELAVLWQEESKAGLIPKTGFFRLCWLTTPGCQVILAICLQLGRAQILLILPATMGLQFFLQAAQTIPNLSDSWPGFSISVLALRPLLFVTDNDTSKCRKTHTTQVQHDICTHKKHKDTNTHIRQKARNHQNCHPEEIKQTEKGGRETTACLVRKNFPVCQS